MEDHIPRIEKNRSDWEFGLQICPKLAIPWSCICGGVDCIQNDLRFLQDASPLRHHLSAEYHLTQRPPQRHSPSPLNARIGLIGRGS